MKYYSNVKNSLVFNVYWQGHQNFLQIAAQIEKLDFTVLLFVFMIGWVETTKKLRQKFRLSRELSTNSMSSLFLFSFEAPLTSTKKEKDWSHISPAKKHFNVENFI